MTDKKYLLTPLAVIIVTAIAFIFLHNKHKTNLILVSIDTLRADRLGCYGHDRPTSPSLDRFAGQCFRFTDVISQSPWTLPSHMSIFTSLYPTTHGVGGHDRSLDPRIATLPEILKQAGYQTGAFVDAKFMKGNYGFQRGFDVYENKKGRGISRVLPGALKWLQEHHQQPFFLFIHVFDCHCPYTPPREIAKSFSPDYAGTLDLGGKCGNPDFNRMELTAEDIAYISEQYDGEIRRVDTEMEKLFDVLKELNLYRNTLIVILSDHGEEMMEHGQIGHQRSVYNELMRVPLLIRLPGKKPPRVVRHSRIEAIDISPTLLDLLGLPAAESFQGESFLCLMRGRREPARVKAAFGELNELEVKRTVYDRGFQYIFNVDDGTEELYDLRKDAQERSNLSREHPDECGYFRSLLQEWENEAQSEGERYRSGTVRLDAETREQLRTLGYIE